MTPEKQDDELLRSYLLGKLPDEDADRLERRLLADDDLFDLAEAVELDLLAAVDRGAFTPAEREQILQKLAASPRGRERLALARSLNAVAAERAEHSNVRPFARRAQAFPPPAIHWMALAASLIMLAGLGRFAWQHRELAPRATDQFAKTPTPTLQPLIPVTPPLVPALPAKTPKSIPDPSAVREKPRQGVPPAILTLSFLTSRGAEESQKLELAPGTRKVEIQIDAEGLEPAGSFDVVVRSREQGKGTILEKKGLAVGALSWGRGLALDVPAERLPAGRYEIAVTPRGGEEVSQDFEVVEGKR
jgi:hypothetical protein